MAESNHLSLKVKLDDDIRRFSVSKEITFIELRSLISKHFVLVPENVQLKYFDDEEELITLGSDLELQEAKRLQPTVLRLNVYDVKPKHVLSGQVSKLEAAFVQDVTVPDSTNVTAGVTFCKVWRVKNSGTEPWPKGVVLKMVDPKDDQLRVLAVGSVNRPVAPGEETDIGVELQSPSRPGRCVQYWRLFTEDGEAFGRRLWLDINVTPYTTALAEKEEEETRRCQEEEERRLCEEENRRRAAEVEERRLREEEEEENRRRAAEEEERRLREEEENRRRAAEEAERRCLQEEERRLREEEEYRRRAAEEEERRLREEEENRRRAAEEEQARLERQKQQEEELKKAEEEILKKRELEEKRKQEEDRRRMHSKYPAQLTALAEMGFTNTERNVGLLDKHKGSLDLALEALLSGQ